MKVLELIKESKEEQEKSIRNFMHTIGAKHNDYEINDDMTVDIFNASFSNQVIVKIPIKIRKFNGCFDCSYSKLTTLKGCPEHVEAFDCDDNELTSLVGGPKTINHWYRGVNNKHLTSFKGIPEKIPGNLNVSQCGITSFEHSPKIIGDSFDVSYNPIDSFEDAPAHIGGDLCINNTNITSLHNIHKHIKFIGCDLYLSVHEIKDSILGLLLIDIRGNIVNAGGKIRDSKENKAFDILRKHNRETLIDCQGELIDAGLDEYAKL